MKDAEPLARFLTPERVADLLRVSHRSVYKWLGYGQRPAVRIGKVLRVRREVIDSQWAQDGSFKPTLAAVAV